MYDSLKVHSTLNSRYLTPYHEKARQEEFKRIVDIIDNLYTSQGYLSILDIGIGDARMPVKLSTTTAWEKISEYIGIDNSQFCINQANNNIRKKGLEDKTNILLEDAKNIHRLEKKFDLILCTYFTAGNFIPPQYSFNNNFPLLDLSENSSFVQVFKSAYNCINNGGELVLGSVYKDNEFTRIVQEDFYKKCNMTIITSPNDSFTATKEGFWSQRFNEEKLLNYFSWVSPEKIIFLSLDKINFAMLVKVNK